jgi:hypothetical protein
MPRPYQVASTPSTAFIGRDRLPAQVVEAKLCTTLYKTMQFVLMQQKGLGIFFPVRHSVFEHATALEIRGTLRGSSGESLTTTL